MTKNVTTFDYIDKILIVLSATSSGVCIILSTNIVGAPVGIPSASFTLVFSRTTRIMKKFLCITRNKQETFYKILMLTKNKLNSIETVVSQVLTDMEINHEEFNAIIKEKQKHETIKENK